MCRLKEYALRLKFFRKLLVRVALPLHFYPQCVARAVEIGDYAPSPSLSSTAGTAVPFASRGTKVDARLSMGV